MSATLDAFIERWQAANGSERANYQLFLTELCELLGLPRPEPASDDTRDNAYVFERRVDIHNADGSVTRGFIDLYRRGSFVLEAKQTGKELDSGGWNTAMLRAQNQADQYARALPADEGRPPFIVVVDVGRSIELYAEFTRTGSTYVPYPDPAHHRIRLDDLRDETIRERLATLWLDPLKLDPSRESARVTRQIADRLARLAKSLEADGHAPERVAHFLMRALFTMFAEDVGLLPEHEGRGAFTSLLESLREHPEHFAPALESLWQTMNHGGFDPRLMARIRRFNGGLFATPDVIPLTRDQIDLLHAAARADWRHVEPTIFGTLLERALDTRERHKLGAHYTPRAYVERLVLPTLIEPLRRDWQTVQIAAEAWRAQGKPDRARDEVRAFHHQLCHTRVLDPACGSGNFLYVALEHMKRLEGEVQNLLTDLGETQGRLDMAGLTVDPHQFLGLEINPRAAAIAEMVLWIGYLQWHYRLSKRLDTLPDPVLRDFHNIEHRDALIAFDAVEYLTDDTGQPLTRWDGVTYKTSPVTGEDIPDETARLPVEQYKNPRKAQWPQAEFIVGNPPFIGASTLRRALGDGYVDALRGTWPEVPESADFVMYWWHIAAETVRAGQARQFGFITTNSIRQTFNRRVVEAQLGAGKTPLALAFAIPDHPWVDAADGAAVRIAMTVGRLDAGEGQLLNVTDERETGEDAHEVTLARREGRLHADLTIGANVAGAVALQANAELSNRGVSLFGAGFIVTPEQAAALGLGRDDNLDRHIRAYRNGRDLMDKPRGVMVIDLFGLTADEVRSRYPAIYQWLLERVKPERDNNNRESRKRNWWLFGETNPKLRRQLASLPRYIATVETAKHRVFQFLDADILPDNMLVNIAVDDSFHLGVLSSRLHVVWALAAGGTLEDRPRYNKTRCFETFPFPLATPEQAERIRALAEQIDTHRKRVQAQHPGLTLTGLYNVLEKLRAGEPLTAKDKTLHETGLVSVLKTLHDDLDRAVFEAYGWDDLAEPLVGRPGATTPLPDKPTDQAAAEEALLTRLVTLNAARAAEEAQGRILWLRPDYQNPHTTAAPETTPLALQAEETDGAEARPPPIETHAPQNWPKDLREQIHAVRALLTGTPQTVDTLAARFKRKPAKAVQTVLEALEGLGLAQSQDTGWRT
ncbi:MAG: class I SAM-dependent DNA methyltransferase [Halothiobacillaceae bacterium]|nr:class I SAM-dependent DNA methyltransferase [Halothiobacillaceae bacterium]